MSEAPQPIESVVAQLNKKFTTAERSNTDKDTLQPDVDFFGRPILDKELQERQHKIVEDLTRQMINFETELQHLEIAPPRIPYIETDIKNIKSNLREVRELLNNSNKNRQREDEIKRAEWLLLNINGTFADIARKEVAAA